MLLRLFFISLFIPPSLGFFVEERYSRQIFVGQNRHITFSYRDPGNIVQIFLDFFCSGNGNYTIIKKGLSDNQDYGTPDDFSSFRQNFNRTLDYQNGGYRTLIFEIICDGYLHAELVDKRVLLSGWVIVFILLAMFVLFMIAAGIKFLITKYYGEEDKEAEV